MNKKILSTALFAGVFAISSSMTYAQVPPPENFDGPKHPQMISPQERQQKIAEFEKRLNLTEEQKALIEKNRAASKKKLDSIRKKELKLREEKRAIFEQNKRDFESILTQEQKEELKKLEEERDAAMKARFKNRSQLKTDKEN